AHRARAGAAAGRCAAHRAAPEPGPAAVERIAGRAAGSRGARRRPGARAAVGRDHVRLRRRDPRQRCAGPGAARGRCAGPAVRPEPGGRAYRRPAAALAPLQGQLRAVARARARRGRPAGRGARRRRPHRRGRCGRLAAAGHAGVAAAEPGAQPARRDPVPAGGLKAMRKAGEIMKSGWFLSLLAVLVLCALVWVAGPWIAIAGREPLAPASVRLATMLGLLLVWAVVLLVLALRRRASARRMDQALEATAATRVGDERDAAAAAERSQLESRFREAVKLLRKRGGRRSLYALPWYVVIGPPGSGKSTLIRNSGLEFPLAGQFGKEALRGVGGTRNCDWWFTGEAVFLDTAGRYTTQDS